MRNISVHLPCKVGCKQDHPQHRQQVAEVARKVRTIVPFKNLKEEIQRRYEESNSEQNGTRFADEIFSATFKLGGRSEISGERDDAEEREEQLDVDGVLDQHAQQTRSDKNQRRTDGRSNAKTEFHVVRFPEQIRSVGDVVGRCCLDDHRVWCFGISLVRCNACVGFIRDSSTLTVGVQAQQKRLRIHVTASEDGTKSVYPVVYCSQNIGFIHALPVGKPCLASSQRSANSDAR